MNSIIVRTSIALLLLFTLSCCKQPLPPVSILNNALSSPVVNSLFVDIGSNLFVGTADGAYRLASDNTLALLTWGDSKPSRNVLAIYRAGASGIYYAGLEQYGVYELSQNVWNPSPTFPTSVNQTAMLTVRAFTRGQYTYAGADDGLIYRSEEQMNAGWRAANGASTTLGAIRTLFASGGMLATGSPNGVFVSKEQATGIAPWFPAAFGIPSGAVVNTLVSANGFIYAGTTQGLFRVGLPTFEALSGPGALPPSARPRDNGEEETASQSARLSPNSEFLKLYPNPTNDLATAEITCVQSCLLRISVRNVLGIGLYTQEVHAENAGVYQMPIDLKPFPPGLYMIEVVMDGTRSVHRLIKQ